MSVEPEPPITERARLVQNAPRQLSSQLPAAEARPHVEPLHFTRGFQRKGTQPDTTYWLSRYRRQQQLALGRSVLSRQPLDSNERKRYCKGNSA